MNHLGRRRRSRYSFAGMADAQVAPLGSRRGTTRRGEVATRNVQPCSRIGPLGSGSRTGGRNGRGRRGRAPDEHQHPEGNRVTAFRHGQSPAHGVENSAEAFSTSHRLIDVGQIRGRRLSSHLVNCVTTSYDADPPSAGWPLRPGTTTKGGNRPPSEGSADSGRGA